MPAPPMKDTIKLFIPQIDPATGLIKKDKYGREIAPTAIESDARVAYTTEVIVNASGQQIEAKLEIDLPSTQEVLPQIKVEWVDRFGNLVTAQIETIGEILNYSGKKVYWRKCYAT